MQEERVGEGKSGREKLKQLEIHLSITACRIMQACCWLGTLHLLLQWCECESVSKCLHEWEKAAHYALWSEWVQ